jgi:hypothetical protein
MPTHGHPVTRCLDSATPPEGPVTLSPAYLAAVSRVESAPHSRDGADKSWVFELLERDRALLARAHRMH